MSKDDRMMAITAALLGTTFLFGLCSCTTPKPPISTAPSFAGVRNTVNDTSKNIAGVRGHLGKAKSLADEVDYKLMKAEGR